MKYFDLNIEKVLENWEVYHAIRELLSNAFDERVITNTRPIKIDKLSSEKWCIRDFGRGIEIKHFTQNENLEKKEYEGLIGKFGVGLKDALATFYRNNVSITIKSCHGEFTTEMIAKDGYDIETLHVVEHLVYDENFIGTEIILEGCNDNQMELAKNQFIQYSKMELLDKTKYGEIYLNAPNENSLIYVNGVKIAEEDNFLFSYNITSITTRLDKSLNRERSNVGRTAYTDRVKSILMETSSTEVLSMLAGEMKISDKFKIKDELKWKDVAVHSIIELNKLDRYVFITHDEYDQMQYDNIDIIHSENREIIVISGDAKRQIELNNISGDETISTLGNFMEVYKENFIYTFVDYSDLSRKEKQVYNLSKIAFKYFSDKYYENRLFISETLTPDISNDTTLGVYDPIKDIIIIKRSVLKKANNFLGVLIHEMVHATTKAKDVSREFEYELTRIIGDFAEEISKKRKWFF